MMTERLQSTTPHSATPIDSALHATVSASRDNVQAPTESLEDEPYTIKCICDYSDDDGNTIYCETCETWQHIECFYPGNVDDASREEFDHSCADCKPRPLDRRNATERQRQQRHRKALHDSGDKKAKRPPSKSHKKKTKPSDVQINGWQNEQDATSHRKHASLHDVAHPPAKRSKGSHRPSQSVSSQHGKRSPSVATLNGRARSQGHPPSPSHTPPDMAQDPRYHTYSSLFLQLYTNDPGPQDLQTNSFTSLAVTNAMSSWLHDSKRLRADTGIDDKSEVFQFVKPGLDLSKLKSDVLVLQTKEQLHGDHHLRWRFLTTKNNVTEGSFIAELKGQVGLQSEYKADPNNSPHHPSPFVFYHPGLPIYVDTRREGSLCRYIRRSCRSNTSIDCYITNETEYHFCIVCDADIAAGDEVTLPWTYPKKVDLILGLMDDTSKESNISVNDISEVATWINLVLSDFGGCACDLGPDCRFARFDRRYFGDVQPQRPSAKSKKGRKSKQAGAQTNGGTSTSRAASEAQPEDYDVEDDSRSTSGSVRSKPQSRDMTPHASGGEDRPSIPSKREERKLAALEHSFAKMENSAPPVRKRKRPANDTASNATTNGTNGSQNPQKPRSKSRASTSGPTPNTNGSHKRNYVDAGTSRQESGSPTTGVSPTAAHPSASRDTSGHNSASRSRQPTMTPPRINYVDATVQTEADPKAWYTQITTPTPKKTYVPLTKRLLNQRLQAKKDLESRRLSHSVMSTTSNGVPTSPVLQRSASMADLTHSSPGDRRQSIASLGGSSSSGDVSMTDAPSCPVQNGAMPPPPVLPAQRLDYTSVLGYRPSDLRVHLPTASSFTTSQNDTLTPSTPNTSALPLAISPTLHHSLVHSPVKKKLSLSDYAKRKRPAEPTPKSKSRSSPVLAPTLSKTPLEEEPKLNGITTSTHSIESPVGEKTVDPAITVATSQKIPAPKENSATEAPSVSQAS